jgi:hypothetical protein
MNKDIAEKKLKEEIVESRKWEKRYKSTKAKFFGICFGNSNIVVTVLQSVADIAVEGQAMHHCVFANEYYKKPDSLILSAKTPEGERLETIEVDLKTFQILQSRGVCNQNTPHHNEIINLVNNNMYRIRQAI